MFGFSWSELLIIGIVALVTVGPNDLPKAMKTAARWMRAGQKLAREFQSHVDDLVREAELDELREKARAVASMSLTSHLESHRRPQSGASRRAQRAGNHSFASDRDDRRTDAGDRRRPGGGCKRAPGGRARTHC